MKKGKKKNKYNYVLLSEVNKMLSTNNCEYITIFEVSSGKDRKLKNDLYETDKLDHLTILVHNSIEFKRMGEKARRKLNITVEKEGDMIAYHIPLKTLRANVSNNASSYASLPVNGFFNYHLYDGELNAFKDNSMLQLAKWIFLCTKKKRIAEVIV